MTAWAPRLLPAVPGSGDVEPILAGGGVGQHRIDRPRLLGAVQDERDLVVAPALPYLGGVGVVHFDRDARVLIRARSTEVVDLKHDTDRKSTRLNSSHPSI